jgi:hypothetical protein
MSVKVLLADRAGQQKTIEAEPGTTLMEAIRVPGSTNCWHCAEDAVPARHAMSLLTRSIPINCPK